MAIRTIAVMDESSPPSTHLPERSDEPAVRASMGWLQIAGWIVLAVVVAVAFVGYRQPDMLLDFVNLRYCA